MGKNKKARKYTGAYGASQRLKNRSIRIASMLRGFKTHKTGDVPAYLEKGINGPDKEILMKMVNKII